jgi:hypothetical protein
MIGYIHLVMGCAGPLLAVSALLLQVLGRARAVWRWSVPLAACAVLSIPFFGGLSAAEHARAYVGDSSVTLVLLLGAAVWHGLRGREVLRRKDLAAVFLCTTAAGLVLYPLALGIGSWDPYELGYRPAALVAVLAVLAIAGRLRGYRTAVFVPIIILAWCAGLWESTNLWDYMLDPLLAMYGVVWLMSALVRRIFGKTKASAAPVATE